MKNIPLFLFLGFLLLYTGIAFYIAYILQIYHNDAISRTALAFFTYFGRNPHLAAVGFVWQPLPSLLQLPFLILLKPLGYMMMAGPIVTAISGALSAVAVYKTSQLLLPHKTVIPLCIALLFGLNPLILLYSTIGTSEIIFISTLLLSTYFMVKWIITKNHIFLVSCSLFISLSFWSRYEALPMFGGYFLLIIYIAYIQKMKLKTLEGALLQFTIPFIYSVLIWMAANFFIMKDPFYFLHSEYSNSAFTTALKNNPASLEYSYNSPLNSFIYVLKRSLILAPMLALLPLLLIESFVFLRKKTQDHILLLAITFPYACVLLFHAFQLYKGDSFGWLRFFIYAIPAGVLMSAYLVRIYNKAFIVSCALLILSCVLTYFAISTPTQGKEEVSFITKAQNKNAQLDFSRTYSDQKAVASLMDRKKGRILLDTNKGFAIPLFSKNPERYTITSDIDFLDVVKNYQKEVNWIIIRKPQPEDLTLNKIYTLYPRIWEGNAPRVKLYKEIDDWRIFFVDRNTKITSN